MVNDTEGEGLGSARRDMAGGVTLSRRSEPGAGADPWRRARAVGSRQEAAAVQISMRHRTRDEGLEGKAAQGGPRPSPPSYVPPDAVALLLFARAQTAAAAGTGTAEPPAFGG